MSEEQEKDKIVLGILKELFKEVALHRKEIKILQLESKLNQDTIASMLMIPRGDES